MIINFYRQIKLVDWQLSTNTEYYRLIDRVFDDRLWSTCWPFREQVCKLMYVLCNWPLGTDEPPRRTVTSWRLKTELNLIAYHQWTWDAFFKYFSKLGKTRGRKLSHPVRHVYFPSPLSSPFHSMQPGLLDSRTCNMADEENEYERPRKMPRTLKEKDTGKRLIVILERASLETVKVPGEIDN